MRYWAVGLACVGGLLMAGTPVVKSVPDPGDVVPWEKHFRAVAGGYGLNEQPSRERTVGGTNTPDLQWVLRGLSRLCPPLGNGGWI